MADLIDRAALLEKLDLLARHEDAFRQTVINGVIFTISQEPAVDADELMEQVKAIHNAVDTSQKTKPTIQASIVQQAKCKV